MNNNKGDLSTMAQEISQEKETEIRDMKTEMEETEIIQTEIR